MLILTRFQNSYAKKEWEESKYLGVAVWAFNPRNLEAVVADICEFEASLGQSAFFVSKQGKAKQNKQQTERIANMIWKGKNNVGHRMSFKA